MTNSSPKPKTVSAAQAKMRFSELLARVAYAGDHYIIERRGKPVAALVSVDELERIEELERTAEEPKGALALIGLWADLVTDTEVDEMVAHIYSEREKDQGRPPPTFD
jgi:prevent-host-death family protein